MIQKFKVTYCAFILCLFGLTLMTVSPVFAQESEYDKCFSMGKKKGKGSKYPYKPRMECFQKLASDLIDAADTGRKDVEAAMNALVENHAGLQDVDNLLTEAVKDHKTVGFCKRSIDHEAYCKQVKDANSEVKHSRIGAQLVIAILARFLGVENPSKVQGNDTLSILGIGNP